MTIVLILLFCWGAQPRSKIVQLQWQRVHSFNPETRIKAVYLFIYIIYSLFIDWVKDSQTMKEFGCKYVDWFFAIQWNGCVQQGQQVWFSQNGMLTMRCMCITHNHAIIAWIIYALEKTIYGLKKYIYGLERLFTDWKKMIYGFEITFAE